MDNTELEQTLVLIKPDALKNSLTGYVLSLLSEFHSGLRLPPRRSYTSAGCSLRSTTPSTGASRSIPRCSTISWATIITRMSRRSGG